MLCKFVAAWRDTRAARKKTVPRPGAIRIGGGRTHSPGAASPSLVWLLLRVGNLRIIFGKGKKKGKIFRMIDLSNQTKAGCLTAQIIRTNYRFLPMVLIA
jgi:hypothetical protein